MKRYIDNWIEVYEEEAGRTDEYQKQLEADWRDAARDVEEAAVVGEFIVSADAAKIMTDLHEERKRADREENLLDQAELELRAIETALERIITLARRDLGIPPRRPASKPSS
jgi:hypothetical protein